MVQTATKATTFLQIIRKIKNGQTSRNEIAEFLTGSYREAALGLYQGMTEQGLDGFAKVYDALKKDNRLLREHEHELLDRPPAYAGTLLSEVTPEPIDWLWKPRLALGRVTMLDGDPGLGKSSITLDLAARLSRGREWPDGMPGIQGGTVLISPENELASDIQPRLARMEASLTRISSLSNIQDGEDERPFCLAEDLRLIEQEIERVQAKLLIIDPLMDIVPPDVDVYKDNHIRAALAPLYALVKRCRVACILVRHFTKSRGSNPLMAGIGSIGMIGLARSGLMVIADPETEGQVLLVHVKNNIGPLAPALRYHIENDAADGDERPYIIWNGASSVTATELFTTPSVNTGGNRKAILDLLKECAPEAMKLEDIAKALSDIKESNLKMTLKRMYEAHEIGKSERGAYYAK